MHTRPSVLILMADQMTANVTAPGHACRMPNARRLASQGVRFTNAACVSPHCCPSRASFFTGHLPSRHGIWNNIDGPSALSCDLKPGIGTFGEQLAAVGYDMGFAGKWHVSKLRGPGDFGWQVLQTNDINGPSETLEVVQHPVAELARAGWGGPTHIFQTEPPSDGQYSHSGAVVRAGVEYIRARADAKKPWCLFLSVDPPHDPYRAPANYVNLYDRDGIVLPESFGDDLADKPRIVQRQRRQLWDRLGADGARECLRHYWAQCTLVDHWLGQLLEALDQSGQAENTVVVFTSDHGDYAGAHGLWCKGVAAFREAYAIPAIVRWPAGVTGPGRDCEALVSIADFAPTFLELAGVRPAADLFGQSLLPFLTTAAVGDWRDALVSQLNGVELYYTQRSIWTRDWKYVFNGFDFDELYDLRQDPHELTNLADPSRGRNSPGPAAGPYPALPPALDAVRRRLLVRLWQVCEAHGDKNLHNGYWTVGLVPYGPRTTENPSC